MLKRLRYAFLICIAVASLGALPAQAYETKSPAAPPPATRVIKGTMTLDCVRMTAQVHDYATRHGYCPSPSVASPYDSDTKYGSCGDSWISIYGTGAGSARVSYGFDSNKGTVTYRNLGVGWSGGEGASGGWNDSGWMRDSSYSATWWYVHTGYGTAYATMGGTVTLWWGAQCTLLQPTASGDIF